MILATRDDVAKRLPDGLDPDTDVSALLEEASVMVESYLNRVFTPDSIVPLAVTIVVSRMVARRVAADADGANDVPDGVNQLGATDFTASFAEPFVSTGVWLNRTDKQTLAPYRLATASFPLTSERF